MWVGLFWSETRSPCFFQVFLPPPRAAVLLPPAGATMGPSARAARLGSGSVAAHSSVQRIGAGRAWIAWQQVPRARRSAAIRELQQDPRCCPAEPAAPAADGQRPFVPVRRHDRGTTSPRNPHYFDTIEGGRNCVSHMAVFQTLPAALCCILIVAHTFALKHYCAGNG